MTITTRTKTSKELRGEAEASNLAVYRLRREIERNYTKDPVGRDYCMSLLNIINRFLDHIDTPLALAGDSDAMCDMRGSNNMQLEAVNRAMGILAARKAELEQPTRFTDFVEKRRQA
jgi:hypothetical protein